MINAFGKKLERKKAIPILLIIIIFYLAICFYNFFEQGLINYDEAFLLITTHTYSDIGKTILFHPQELFSSNYYEKLIGNYGNIYTAGRPIYILLASAIDIIWKSEHSTRLLNIIVGCFILLFFYKILAFYQINAKVKIISSILFVASPLFLIYSRLGLSQILSALFLIIALFYLLKFSQSPERKYLIFTGISTGLLLMSHYIALPLILILIIYTLFLLYKKRTRVLDCLSYLLSLIILPLVWEVITRLGVFLARVINLGEASQKVFSYSGEIIEQSKYGQGLRSFILDQPLFYFKLLLSSENLIILILFFLGLFLVIRNIKQAKYHLMFSLIFPFLILCSFLLLKYTRNIVPILPLFYLLTAFGLGQIYLILKRVISERKIYLILFSIVISTILLNASSYFNILNLETSVDKIVAFVGNSFEAEEVQIYSSSAPIWRAYLPEYDIELYAKMELKELAEKDKKIIVISDYYTKIDDPQRLEQYQKKLIAQYPTNIFRVKPLILDLFYKDEDYMKEIFRDNFNSKTEVYQIEI